MNHGNRPGSCRRTRRLALLAGAVLAALLFSGCLKPNHAGTAAVLASEPAPETLPEAFEVLLVKDWERSTISLDAPRCDLGQTYYVATLPRFSTLVLLGTDRIDFQVSMSESITTGLRVGAALDGGPIQWSPDHQDSFLHSIPVTEDQVEPDEQRWTFHIRISGGPALEDGCTSGAFSGARSVEIYARST